MRLIILSALLIAACNRESAAPVSNEAAAVESEEQASGWELQSSGEGAALVIAGAGGDAALRLFCPARKNELLVNVSAFQPIGSEERLSFGQGGEAVALVADSTGDEARGGVTATGPVPGNLVQLLSGDVAASYGAQTSGPHPAPPADLVNAFGKACTDGSSAEGSDTPPPSPAEPGESPPPTAPSGNACLTSREGEPVPANALRGVGTEPFWAVKVEGRCVTYSHPENQSGTRVWTEFSGSARNGTWRGVLNNLPFVMRTRPQPGCSDGMSDNRYPIAVALTVNGDERSGCAEPR